jgi:hypothetical protein
MKNERKIEMTFDYNTLKRAARDGSRLGNWNGKAVFAASAESLENKGSGAYYILYDDENRIVARTTNGWKSYGEVTSQGSVNEYSSARNYKTPAEAAAAARKAKAKEERKSSTSGMRYSSEPIPQATVTVSYAPEGSYAPGYDRTERPVGDVKTGLDVEKTLKMAREMSIDDLLEGFLPGLSYDVVAKG